MWGNIYGVNTSLNNSLVPPPHPQDAQILIIRPCEYVTLPDQKDFSEVIKDFEMWRLPWFNWWVQYIITGSL